MKSLLILALIVFTAQVVWAQKADPDDPQNIEKGKKLLQQTIEARGGAAFLGYKTFEAIGQWTPFEQGLSTSPVPFVDYIIVPDRERTEFGRGKKRKDRKINVNEAASGWAYDGEGETLKDQTEKQIKEFQESREADLDMLLRTALQKGEIRFFGREETRPGERADIVAIKLRPERVYYLMIDPYSKLPARLAYEKNEEGGIAKYEYRFNQYVVYDGVKFPNIVDLYRNNIQLSRAYYENIKLNGPIPEALFVKPASAKAIK